MQSQEVVTAYFSSNQLLPFDFAERSAICLSDRHHISSASRIYNVGVIPHNNDDVRRRGLSLYIALCINPLCFLNVLQTSENIDTMGIRITASAAHGAYGFIAEVVTYPFTPGNSPLGQLTIPQQP